VSRAVTNHKLKELLDQYLKITGLEKEPGSPLFPASIGKTGKLSRRPLVRTDAADMLKRRLKQAGLPAHYCLTHFGRPVSRISWKMTALLKPHNGSPATPTAGQPSYMTGAVRRFYSKTWRGFGIDEGRYFNSETRKWLGQTIKNTHRIMSEETPKKPDFWKTLEGKIIAITGVVIAIGGLWTAIQRVVPWPPNPLPPTERAETAYFEIASQGQPDAPGRLLIPDSSPNLFHPLPNSIQDTFGSRITHADLFLPDKAMPPNTTPPTPGYWGKVEAKIDPESPNRVGIIGAMYSKVPPFKAKIRVVYEK
jgi:hypothetical protein